MTGPRTTTRPCHPTPVAAAEDQPARQTRGRLEQLLDMREQLDAAIAQEQTLQQHHQELLAHVSAAVTRGSWPNRVCAGAARHFDVPVEAIRSANRTRAVMAARQVACYLLHQDGWTYSAIGRELHRDHASVMHAHKRVEDDPRLQAAAASIHQQLTALPADLT